MRRALPFVLALAAAAASCTPTQPRVGVDTGGGPPPPRASERPFITHLEALEHRYLVNGDFEPGVETVSAPIHSGVHATLYFVALRGKVESYANPEHEESWFIFSGSGTLDLPGGQKRPIEGGHVVRVPPRFAHGFTGARNDPIHAVMVVSPAVEDQKGVATTADLPGARGRIFVNDVSSTQTLAALPAAPPGLTLPPDQDHVITKSLLDPTVFSTLQVAAVRRKAIPNHVHRLHDETVIIFAQAGFGFLRMGEVVHPVQCGMIAHIPQGTLHYFEHQAEGHARAVSFFTPGYDGSDSVLVDDTGEVKAPPGYKQTHRDGDFRDVGTHSDGDYKSAPGGQ